jgi:SAM-dependent methyltransferase
VNKAGNLPVIHTQVAKVPSTPLGFAHLVRQAAKRVLRQIGVRPRTSASSERDHSQYIPFEETIAAAKAANLPVGDYLDRNYNVAGATQRTIDEMSALRVFDRPPQDVCEIGPGSGRYLTKIVAAFQPSHYEIYETAEPWARYLVREYQVVYRQTDGRSLAETPTASIDLVQAHKVFVTTPFVSTWSYLREMIRVTRPGGHIVFDIMTERCVEPNLLDGWILRSSNYYPSVFPRDFALRVFEHHGATFVGSFFVPMRPGQTETFVFRK